MASKVLKRPAGAGSTQDAKPAAKRQRQPDTGADDSEPGLATLMTAHRDLMEAMKQQTEEHTQLMHIHMQLLSAHADVLKKQKDQEVGDKKKKPLKKHPSLGVLRLDYNYPPAPGDMDSTASFGYDVFYRVVPGMTFEMAQAGDLPVKIKRRMGEAIRYLQKLGCAAITGDCGFMMAYQIQARDMASIPLFMSSLVQSPTIAAAFEPKDRLLILTANGEALRAQKDVLLTKCGINVDEDRFLIKGCQDVPGFEAVANGEAVDVKKVQPGIVKMTLAVLKQNPDIKGIILECTELPAYADALRATTGKPVWDCITAADYYVSAFLDNPRFGIDDWQAEWDQEQEDYTFGMNLTDRQKSQLVTPMGNEEPSTSTLAQSEKKKKVLSDPVAKAKLMKAMKRLTRKKAPILGVIRLDYNYPPAAGDIDCPGSFDYDVLYRVVPGLTFEMAQSGVMSPKVEPDFIKAIHWLESKGVSGIIGDCGFMMAFQPMAAKNAKVPVFMSSLMQCPMVSACYEGEKEVLVLTANSETLKPLKQTLLNNCGFDVDDERFMIVGCQDVDGFEAVANGTEVDVEKVTPGIVELVQTTLKAEPSIRAILSECTELPAYSDAIRKATGLPVFDAITCADLFISAYQDNPRFGLNQWQNDWDGQVDEYTFGENLTPEEKARLET